MAIFKLSPVAPKKSPTSKRPAAIGKPAPAKTDTTLSMLANQTLASRQPISFDKSKLEKPAAPTATKPTAPTITKPVIPPETKINTDIITSALDKINTTKPIMPVVEPIKPTDDAAAPEETTATAGGFGTGSKTAPKTTGSSFDLSSLDIKKPTEDKPPSGVYELPDIPDYEPPPEETTTRRGAIPPPAEEDTLVPELEGKYVPSMDELRIQASRALQSLYGGGPTEEQRDEYIKTLQEGEKGALESAQRTSDIGAMGLSGAGQALQSDIGRVGERSTRLAVDQYDTAARQEEAARALEAIGLTGALQRGELEKAAYEEAKKEMGTTETLPDGSIKTTFPDGSSEVVRPDGTVTKLGPIEEGYAEQETASYEYVKANATEVSSMPEGAIAVYRGDGYVYYKNPDNSYVKVPDRTIRTD